MNLSPSQAHAVVAKSIKPQLAYAGQPLKAWQRKVRAKTADLLKLSAIEPAPLKPKSIWKREHPHGTVEKISFTAEKGADVVAYWCTPSVPSRATFICLQGHGSGIYTSLGLADDEQTPVQNSHDLEFANVCLSRGIAALCVEQRSFGLRRELVQKKRSDRSCREAVVRAMMLGRVLTGERVFDVIRSVDWLLNHTDVDPETIGVLGHSGGGATAMFSFAVDDRIKFGMVSAYVASFFDSVVSIGHCECNAIPGILEHVDVPDLLASCAPRSLVVVNGKDDSIFPIVSAKKAVAVAKKAYAAAGAKDKLKFVIGDGGHRFFEQQAWDAMLDLLPERA